MLVQHLALVSETSELGSAELATVGAALQTQVTRDLAPTWSIAATLDVFPSLDAVPAGYWPIIVTAADARANNGVHVDDDGAPYAQVLFSSQWSIDASSACLELLANPFGNRTAMSSVSRANLEQAEFLVEITGTCCDPAYAYAINGVLVSDFCTPAFFQNAPPSSVQRYSLNGCVRAPLELLPRGQIAWYSPASNSWWARNHWGDSPIELELGAVSGPAMTARDLLPRRPRFALPLLASEALREQLDVQRTHAEHAARLRARRLRTLVGFRSARSGESLAQQRASEPAVQRDPVLALADAEPARSSAPRRSSPPPLPKEADRSSTESVWNAPSIAPIAFESKRRRRGRVPMNNTRRVAAIAVLGLLVGLGAVTLLRDDAAAPQASAVAATSTATAPASSTGAGMVEAKLEPEPMPVTSENESATAATTTATDATTNLNAHELAPALALAANQEPKRTSQRRTRASSVVPASDVEAAAQLAAPAPEPTSQLAARPAPTNLDALIDTRR